MYKSVIIYLNNFMKLTRHGDIQYTSCSLSFSFRGYYLSNSISCSLSFLTKRENNLNGYVLIKQNSDRYFFGKISGHVSSLEMTEMTVKLMQETICFQIRGCDLGSPNAEKITISELSRESDQTQYCR